MRIPPLKGTNVDYCLECSEKHLQSFRVFIKEGIQRAEKHNTINHPTVQEKIRDAVAELTGCEDDTTTTLNAPKVTELNTKCRDLRRFIWDKKLSFGQGSIEDLKNLYKKATETVDALYESEIAPTYNEEIEQILKDETPQINTAIEEAIKAQKTDPPKKRKQKINIEKLAELTPEETEEALYKDMIKKYANVYTPAESDDV